MKSLLKEFFVVSVAGLFFFSCAKDSALNYHEYEAKSLKAWLQQNDSLVLENFRPVGKSGYYFDILDTGTTPDATDTVDVPIGKEPVWVSFDLSARDLRGNIVLTRNAYEAKLLNTFTKYTRYVPYYRYCGDANSGLLEGAYLAMRDTLVMGENYFAKYNSERGFESKYVSHFTDSPRKVRLHKGTKIILYLPSILIGGDGISGSGGYEGQNSLTAQRPVRLVLEVKGLVKNPLEAEGQTVDTLAFFNGGKEVYNKKDNPITQDTNSVHHPHNPNCPRWVSACDTIAQVYVNHRFNPKTDRFQYWNTYRRDFAPYNNMEDLENKIAEALEKRFHADKPYPGVAALHADSVKLDGTAKIWYIGRFLDGFIFDTNINEVKDLIYDKDYTKSSSPLSYTPKEGGLIKAFHYAVPGLRFGQWATMITVSTHAYGVKGKSGSTTTSSSGGSSMGNYDYYNYLNYVNNYYGGYYGGYYDNYYGGYGGYDPYYGGYYNNYYDNYYNQGAGNETTTVKTVTTEIPSFAPLMFEFYIEPKVETNLDK